MIQPSLQLLVVLLSGALTHAQEQPAGRACHSSIGTDSGIVMWGGATACGVGVLSDSKLWLWNGKQWRSLSGPPIEPREDALLLDTRAGTSPSLTLLGGRRDGKAYADVWRFDDNAWRAISAQGGPGPIEHAAAAYDPVRKRVVVFGGAVGREFRSKTHEWDGDRWHEFDVPGPAARVGHGMAWSQVDGGVLLYGGFATDSFRDLWKWNGKSWERLAENGPTFTEGHVVAEADPGVYVVGPGLENSTTVRVWHWIQKQFKPLGGAGPPHKVGATATYDRKRKTLLYWGGSGEAGAPSSFIHEFDGSRWQERSDR